MVRIEVTYIAKLNSINVFNCIKSNYIQLIPCVISNYEYQLFYGAHDT